MTNDEDLKIANAATQGIWQHAFDDRSGEECVVVNGSAIAKTCWNEYLIEVSDQEKANAKYIAHFGPKKIKSMLQEIEELRKDRDRLDWIIQNDPMLDLVGFKWRVYAKRLFTDSYDTPRDAIDGAINQWSRKKNV